MLIRLEHANIQVEKIQAVADFLLCALPEFSVRFDSGVDDPERWMHVGNADYYLALNLASTPSKAERKLYSTTAGLNHLAFVVEDVESLRKKLLLSGYEESTLMNAHPSRKRIYFVDPEGGEWEFVEYLSDNKIDQNDYIL